MQNLLQKLEGIHARFEDVQMLLSSPETLADMKKFTKLNKEYGELSKINAAYLKFKKAHEDYEGAKEILNEEKDKDMRDMAKMEMDELEPQLAEMQEEIKMLLIPKDPEDSKNAVLEIRAGTGGNEASLFVGDLFRMYTKYCEGKKWKTEVVEAMDGTAGGYSKIIMEVNGKDAYGFLKFESGVHRVQRVPETESQGRVHTSACNVIVLPEAEEFDVDIKDSDLRIDSYCSSGPGGQSVNTTYSAIRITHLPTGLVAQCQDQKSKFKNMDKAMKVLRSRVYELELSKKLEQDSQKRKSMVVTGDRSAKIRTYNYPQSRLTDHRINLTLYSLNAVMNGDLNETIDALRLAENTERLKETEV